MDQITNNDFYIPKEYKLCLDSPELPLMYVSACICNLGWRIKEKKKRERRNL